MEQLHTSRELRSEYPPESNANITRGPARVSAKLFITVDMAVQGFGCVLPCALVEEFAVENAGAAGCSLLAEGDCY